jgi:hypothetical protein
MAFRYRQNTPQTGDIVDPEDWNENVREMISEFNGHLDRDNIPEQSITTAMCSANIFHTVRSDFTDRQVLSKKTQDYVVINRIEFNSQYDGVVICEWSGNWEFGAVENNVTSSTNANIISVRIIVNGIEACEIFRSPDWATKDCGYVSGALSYPAGIVRIESEAKIQNMRDNFVLKNCTGDVTVTRAELIVTQKVR